MDIMAGHCIWRFKAPVRHAPAGVWAAASVVLIFAPVRTISLGLDVFFADKDVDFVAALLPMDQGLLLRVVVQAAIALLLLRPDQWDIARARFS